MSSRPHFDELFYPLLGSKYTIWIMIPNIGGVVYSEGTYFDLHVHHRMYDTPYVLLCMCMCLKFVCKSRTTSGKKTNSPQLPVCDIQTNCEKNRVRERLPPVFWCFALLCAFALWALWYHMFLIGFLYKRLYPSFRRCWDCNSKDICRCNSTD